MHQFLGGPEGNLMRNGGDLLTAYRNGSMNDMIYTHYFNGGSNPSYFVTMDGVSEFLRILPDQIEEKRCKFQELFDSYRASSSSTFNLDTEIDGCAADDDDIDGVLDVVPQNAAWKYQLETLNKHAGVAIRAVEEKSAIALEAEKVRSALAVERVMHASDVDKSSILLKMKDIEMEKERERHRAEKAEWEKERFRLERDEMNAKISRLNEELLSSSRGSTGQQMVEQTATGQQRVEQTVTGQQRVEQTATGQQRVEQPVVVPKQNRPQKLTQKHSYFFKLKSCDWDNELSGVNYFVELDDAIGSVEQLMRPVPPLFARVANGVEDRADARYHIFGFFYKGDRVSKQLLQRLKMVKEAYGVEVDGFQYVCIVLYMKERRLLGEIAFAPYCFLPSSVIPELIRGPDAPRHISVYDTKSVIDDPVLSMLKKPCASKWKWSNSRMSG
jgi:hypothetical protein